MKLIIRLLTLLVLLSTGLTSYAYDFEVDGIFYTIISTGDLTCSVEQAKDVETLVIPQQVKYLNRDFTVVGIWGLGDCKNMKEVILPQSITSLNSGIFSDCKSLSIINLDNINAIGKSCFAGCEALSEITIDSKCKVSASAFRNCTSLKTVYYYSNRIPEYCFAGCISLENVILSDNIYSIGDSAFYGCKSLTSIDLYKTNYLGDECFAGCDNLKSVSIPSSVYFKLDNYQHADDGGLFNNCKSLESVEWDAKILPYNALSACPNLNTLIIGPNVEIIAMGHFQEYNNIKSYYDSFAGTTIKNLFFEKGKQIEMFFYDKSATYVEDRWTNVAEQYGGVSLWGDDTRYYRYKASNLISNVENLYFNRRIKGIRDGSWFDKYNLKQLIIGDEVQGLYELGANLNVEGLEYLKSENTIPPVLSSDGYDYVPFTTQQYINMKVDVPIDALEAYKNAPVWRNFWNINGYDGTNDIEVGSNADQQIVVYNLQGVKMNISTREELPVLNPGLYIINGKKEIVR